MRRCIRFGSPFPALSQVHPTRAPRGRRRRWGDRGAGLARLHLSSRSSTGYAGVRKQEQASGSRGRRPPWASGRFTAYHTVDGRQIFIGFFDSAVEAAVAYARAEGSVDGQVAPPAGREVR